MRPFVFETTKSIVSEIGAIKRIKEICLKLKITRPLVVTDQGIVNCGLLSAIKEPLTSDNLDDKINVHYFDKVIADPPESLVEQAVVFAKQNNINGVIGFGGGSSMDTAKLVALLANSDEQLSDIYGIEQINGERLPLILIPTTAGTGSEVTPIAIVTTGETTKAGVVSGKLLPDVALLDAELTLGLPAHVTAATGIDAMVHAIEAYTSAIKKNPYSDLLAKQALTLLSKNIVEVTFNGKNLHARQAMLLGACLAGQAFANAPVAAVHALAYPLGGHFHIPHGLSNSLVLPHVMAFNLSHASEQYAELASCIDSKANMALGNEKIANNLIDYIRALIKQLKLPTSLAELNIKADDIELLANDAMLQARLLVNNPKLLELADVREIYQQALKGF